MSESLRVRLIAAGVLILVFVAGVTVGLALDRPLSQALESMHAQAGETAEPNEDADEGSNTSRGWIIDRVDLTEGQQVQVDSVLAYYQDRMAELQGEYAPRYREIVETTREAIKALLTDEQEALYDSLLRARDRRQ